MFRIAFNERFDESGFTDTWRADDGDDDGGAFFGETVDKGDMEALFFDLYYLLEEGTRDKVSGIHTS